ncbi:MULTISPECIES: STAS domain-containing protein [Streptomycetaceae]|uniref:Anti-sigma factor antagonist n=1 Tax=Streptantibioticus cattleyicolor (strain ATCC 35852 / DSM 46488 / JCM 4925 / NBRC 14057 / NRRL 8057) TaxID=1003195 RepID=F8JNQ3_STREN|nr:STAS domain-containing protein [Streptantibioticus cattleyicolor]AEW92633.1 anti-sigma factor antagonist [Streptantibioticus cattleyicolor NRRL 8057 = DSM 46488]MYS57411.1 anti-sigma factor antagonist [Streptomyces sp. SID5468]CCB72988.1 Anti-sigma factor antagonist [Streptantibioticus cattleyicolor NRRL 8057 = DSM 46488]
MSSHEVAVHTTDTTPLSVQVTVADGERAVVRLGGSLDAESAAALHLHLANQLRHGHRHLVVDLSGVPFMDSSGLNVILRAMQEVRRMDGGLCLAAASEQVRRVLDLTGVSLLAPAHDTVEEALADDFDPLAQSLLAESALRGPDTSS